jgi:hypothetical protein
MRGLRGGGGSPELEKETDVRELTSIHPFLFVIYVLRKDGSAFGGMIGKGEGTKDVGFPVATTGDPTTDIPSRSLPAYILDTPIVPI